MCAVRVTDFRIGEGGALILVTARHIRDIVITVRVDRGRVRLRAPSGAPGVHAGRPWAAGEGWSRAQRGRAM